MADMTPLLQHRPGAILSDQEGNPIASHGGGLLRHGGVWYWYGEGQRPAGVDTTGVTCYASSDLMAWRNLGTVLSPAECQPHLPPGTSRMVIERPKVIYHERTKRFVMWMHLDGDGYTRSLAGVAVSERPEGPFRLLRCFRPLHHAEGIPQPDERNETGTGRTYNDMNLLVDDDGSAYVFYTSEKLMTLYISRLAEDWTDVERPAVLGRTWTRALPGRMREAPTPFKHDGRYYLFSSGCVGWIANPLAWASAAHPLGPWTHGGDPCCGPWADTGYDTQPTCVIPAPGGAAGTFLYLGDRWKAGDLPDSRHIWLPFRIDQDMAIRLDWRSRWDASILAPRAAPTLAPQVHGRLCCPSLSPSHPDRAELSWESVPGADLYIVRRNGLDLVRSDATTFSGLPGLPGVPGSYTVTAATLTGGAGPESAPVILSVAKPRPCQLSDHPAQRRWTGFGNALPDQAWSGDALAIGSRTYAKGLLTHSEAALLWDLGGCYATFQSDVGLMPSPAGGSASFRVRINGREVYDSGLRRSGEEPLACALDCRGARTLEILVVAGEAGIGFSHAVWGEARLSP